MERKYFTKKGSVYIQSIRRGRELWIKQERDGRLQALVGGIHISRKKFSELIKEYPSTLLDTTYCFGLDVEREFFEDAKRERFTGSIEDEDTIIFFLVKRRPDKYGIGCSSSVVSIEESNEKKRDLSRTLVLAMRGGRSLLNYRTSIINPPKPELP